MNNFSRLFVKKIIVVSIKICFVAARGEVISGGGKINKFPTHFIINNCHIIGSRLSPCALNYERNIFVSHSPPAGKLHKNYSRNDFKRKIVNGKKIIIWTHFLFNLSENLCLLANRYRFLQQWKNTVKLLCNVSGRNE